MPILQWKANEPAQVQLKFGSGKHVAGRFGERVMFSLADGNVMYVPLIVEKQLQALQVRPLQTIEICKHQADGKTEWKVRRLEAPKRPVVAANGHAQPVAELLAGAPNLDGPDMESYAERNLEQALRISLMAAKKAEDFGQRIGKPIQFDKGDVRSMALTLVINGRGRAA